MNDYQAFWINKNKKVDPKINRAAYLIAGFVCLVVGLNLYQAVSEVPRSIDNLTFGLTWLLTFFCLFFGCITIFSTFIIPFQVGVLKEQLKDRNEEAKDTYKKIKNELAQYSVSDSKGSKYLKRTIACVSAVALLANGSYICGMSYLFFITVMTFSKAINEQNCPKVVQELITPENVTWLESPKIGETVVLQDVKTVNVLELKKSPDFTG